ncbi:MAG: TonB family protein [Dysgonamonadaceae bacterium]|jgi:protein TonB|nr:TonB family protein [Dysgonamonadaceae bacterium]
MEEKKTPGADLENEKSVFLLMGFVVVLSLLFVAFEWRYEQEEDYPDPATLSNLFVEEAFDMEFGLPLETQSAKETEDVVLKSDKPEDILANESMEVEIEGFDVKEGPLVQKEIPDAIRNSSIVEHRKPDTAAEVKSLSDEMEQQIIPPEEVDTMPEFPGGRGALIRYIYQNLKYPSVALKQRIQGKVVCSFIIMEDGSVTDVKLEQGIYIFLDEEALRVLRVMPEWKPGMKGGKGIKMKCYVPVVFKL